MNSFTHNHVLVLGAGRSGCAAAELLVRKRLFVSIVDAAGDLGQCDELKELGVVTAFNVDRLEPHLGEATVAIVSPGIAREHPWLEACRRAGIELLSEFELGTRFLDGRILAITGSLGKSTCTALSTYALNQSGMEAVAGGNYGVPVCELAMRDGSADWYVLEVSSFQLETMQAFKPDVALLMNIFPNHLDRHNNMACYVGLKMRVFANMGEGDTALLPVSLADELLWLLPPNSQRKTFGIDRGDFSLQVEYTANPLLREGVSAPGRAFPAWPEENVAGWIAAMQAIGVPRKAMSQALEDFPGLPHRMECLGEVNGIQIINDSKSTCLQATQSAVESVPGPVHLILGGRSKGESDLSLKEVLEALKVNVYLVGEAGEYWYEEWQHSVPCRLSRTLDAALEDSLAAARSGDTILLSPGCTSFDQFENFEARGKAFKEIVEQWITDESAKVLAG